MDLERIGAFCKDRDILFCVDAIQSLGALVFNGEAIQADFIVADGHKWMMGPEGCALFYSTPQARDRLQLYQYGWHMREGLYQFDPSHQQSSNDKWHIAQSARRFEAGSLNMLGIHGLEASLSLLEEVGMSVVESRILHHSQRLIAAVENHPRLSLITPTAAGRYGGIVTFGVDGVNIESLHQAVTKQGIQCAVRAGGLRFSPHFYITTEAIDQSIESVTALL